MLNKFVKTQILGVSNDVFVSNMVSIHYKRVKVHQIKNKSRPTELNPSKLCGPHKTAMTQPEGNLNILANRSSRVWNCKIQKT